MDTITHIVLGASLGEAIAGKKMGKQALLWGALANNLPDIDVFFSSFQNVANSLLSHRGFTHSILFAAIMTPALGFCFQYLFRKKNYGITTWMLLFGTGAFSHILIDACTNYGTGWFEPFSHDRISFNTIFVLDPFFTISLLISFVALLILRAKSPARKYWLIGSWVISGAYLLFTFVNKVSVNQVFRKSLREENISYNSFITTPTPLNNFLWYCLAKNDSSFYIGYYSIFDESSFINIYPIPKNDFLLDTLKTDPGVKKLIRFSQDYYCVSKSDSGGIDFHDMRFGQVGGWDDPNASFVFSYHITKDKYSGANINQGRFEASTGEAFQSLVRRIKGIKQ